MEWQLALFCLIIPAPVAFGLRCYECDGQVSGDGANGCVDAVVSQMALVTCTTLKGGTSFCSQIKNEGQLGDITFSQVNRGCYEGTSDTEVGCTENSVTDKGASGEQYICFCDKDKCNGQTNQASAIVPVLVSLFLTMFTYFC